MRVDQKQDGQTRKSFLQQPFAGWQLAAGLLIFTIMTLIVGEVGEHIVRGHPLTLTDAQFSAWLYAHRSPNRTLVLRLATELGSTWWAICTALGLGIFLATRRQFYWLAAVWLSVFGGMGLNVLLKRAFHRTRPSLGDPILSLTGYSFPSGHTMAATVLYAVIAAFLFTHVKHFAARVLSIVSAGSLIALVGFSRIYLGAHYLTDVLGAIAEGLAWSTLCLTLFYSAWRHRAAQKKAG